MAAVTMTAAGAALVTHAAALAAASSGTLSAANCTAIGQYLAAAALYPAARQSVGALIQNAELIPA